MRGQGGAWSLVCGLWGPGDPQFKGSLPVARGALSRATVEVPSYSWERIMESQSKAYVHAGLEYPDVNQDSKAAQINYQSTTGTGPELSTVPNGSMNGINPNKCLVPEHPKRVRHPDCKHTEQELRQMASTLKNLRMKKSFIYETYYKGVDPYKKMEEMSKYHSPKFHSKRTRRKGKIPQGDPQHTQTDSGHSSKNVLPKQVSASTSRDTVGPETSLSPDDIDNTVEINVKSADSSVPSPDEHGNSRSDTSTNLAKGMEEHPCEENGLTSERPKRVRHPDCKHTEEELQKMSTKLKSRKLRSAFIVKTFCYGADPDQILGQLQSKEQHYGNLRAPREVLKRMALDWPTMKLKTDFLRATYLGADPYRLMNEMLARPDVQEVLDDYKKKRFTSGPSKQPAQPDCTQVPMNQEGSSSFDHVLQPEGCTKELAKSTIAQNTAAAEEESGTTEDSKIPSTCQDSVKLGTSESADNVIDGVTLESAKLVRHANCKHSEEELLQMSHHLDTQRWRDKFMFETYCEGAEPHQTMVDLFGKELDQTYNLGPNIPRTEVKKMGKILPNKKLRKYFFQGAMKGQDPNRLLNKFLSRRDVQQNILRKKLLISEEQLSFQVFQQPVVLSESKPSPAKANHLASGQSKQPSQKWNEKIVPPHTAHEMADSSQSKSGMPKPAENSPCNENELTRCEDSNPGTSNSEETAATTSVPLKEWLGRFVKDGLTLNTAFGRVKELILHRGTLNKGNTGKEGTRPSDTDLANQSSQVSSETAMSCNVGFSDKDLKERPRTSYGHLGKKQRKKRNKMFRKLNEEQMKAYVKWRVQGLGHHRALNEVLPLSQELRTGLPGEGSPSATAGPRSAKPKPTRQFSVGERQQMQLRSALLGQFSLPPGGVPLPTDMQNTPMPSVPYNMLHPCQVVQQDSSGMPLVALPGPSYSQNSPGLNFETRVPKRSRFVDDDHQDPSSSGDHLHLYIIPTGYPKERLSGDQMDAIESTILDAIVEIKEESMKPIFKGSFRNKGRYEVICEDQLTKTWLYTYATRLYQAWPNASLKIVPASSIKVKACAVLPLCRNDDSDVILKFIGTQNKELNVGKWEVFQRRNDVEDTSLCMFIDEDSADVLRKCGTIDFKTGIAVIVIIEDIEDGNQLSSGLRNSGTGQSLGASGSASTRSSSGRNLQKEQARIPQDEHHLQIGESAGRDSSEYSMYKEPPLLDRPFQTPPNQNFELLHASKYGPTSRRYHQDNRGSRDGFEHIYTSSYFPPSSAKQNLSVRNEPKVTRRRSQEYGHSEYVEPTLGGVSRQDKYEPWIPKRVFGHNYSDYGGPSEHIRPSLPGQTPCDDYSFGRHMAERGPGKHLKRSPSPEHNSSRDRSRESSVEYDELLRSMMERCRKEDRPSPDDPTSSAREPPKVVSIQPPACVSLPPIDRNLDCSYTRTSMPHQIHTSGGRTAESRSSSYSSAATLQKRSRRSPPPSKSGRSGYFSSRH